MKTLELLKNIESMISTNPTLIEEFNWLDITDCIKEYVKSISVFFTSERFSCVNEKIQKICCALENASFSANHELILNTLSSLISSLVFLPDEEISEEWEMEHIRTNALVRHYKSDTVVVIGDSHANFFSGAEHLNFHPIGNGINLCPQQNDMPFTVMHLGPCLAYNSNKSDTSNNFLEKINLLHNNFIKPSSKIIVCLGEIDLRVHVYKQAERQNKTYKDIVDSIILNYSDTLLQLKRKNYKVYCWGPIPSQKDNCPIDANYPRYADEVSRNKATEYFNNKLQEFCLQNDIGFLSIFSQLINSGYLTKEEYISSDRCHLSQSAFAMAYEEWINKQLF